MVIDKSLPLGLMANTAAIMGITMGKEMPEVVGANVSDQSGNQHLGIIEFPVPILKGSPEGKLPLAKWRAEYGKLQQAYQQDCAKYTPIWDDLMKLYRVKSVMDSARRQQEQTQAKHRDRDMER